MRRRLFFLVTFALLFAGEAAAQSRRAECNGRAVRIHPVPGTHAMPPYPAISQRMGEQSETVLRLRIGTDGSVHEAAVLHSSGSRRLDEAALNFVRTHWRWQGAFGCRTAVTQVTVDWRLTDPRP